MNNGPKITQTRLIIKFIKVSPIFAVYPRFCTLKDISSNPKNNNALPDVIVKNIPNGSSDKSSTAAIIKLGVTHPKSGIGKDCSNPKTY